MDMRKEIYQSPTAEVISLPIAISLLQTNFSASGEGDFDWEDGGEG